LTFSKPLSQNEKRVIRILTHPHKTGSYSDIADSLNRLLKDYNGGKRTKWVVYKFVKRNGESEV